jgi:hypothetical protein
MGTDRCAFGWGFAMTARSSSAEAIADVAAAEARLARRVHAGRTFRSVEAALDWYLGARESRQAAHATHPRGEKGRGGEVVFLDIDGGRGGDIDEDHATLMTVSEALGALKIDNPQAYTYIEWQFLGDTRAAEPSPTVLRDMKARVRDAHGLLVDAGRAETSTDLEDQWNDLAPKKQAAIVAAVAELHGLSEATVRGWWRRCVLARSPTTMTLREMSDRSGESLAKISATIGQGISFLKAWFLLCGVVR